MRAHDTKWSYGMLKEHYHCMNLTACPIEFIKTVEADLYIRPKLPFCINSTATSHQIMTTIDEMDKWIACTDTTRSGG